MWNKESEKYLIENYCDITNKELCELLKISEKKLTSKAYRLGLTKSSDHKSKMIGRRNKMVGRDLCYDTLKVIALKYKTRCEFQSKDSSAYSSAQKSGILDEICSHMIIQAFSIPQLIMRDILDKLLKTPSTYNNRKVLKPYEIDVYYEELKLGFEYNGRGWHKNNERDELKLKKAKEMGIMLINIDENNRKYESDIKNQIIKNLPLINKQTRLSLTPYYVDNIKISDVYSLVYNFEDMFNVAKKYSNKKEFRLNDRKTYDKLYKLGKLSEAIKYFRNPVS
jgi:hypothetical protein